MPKKIEIPAADLNLSMSEDDARAELETMHAEVAANQADKIAQEEAAQKRGDKAFVYEAPPFDSYRYWALHYLAAGQPVPKRGGVN